jgi:EAL domain-containing protein (putative c-di-GMP-specific phosphodiesterase class I)
MAFLAKNNCNVIQGFLISKALPINKCIELIEGYNVTHTLSVGQNKNKK